ncbi:MAG: biotin--[acetyl-CoA-carboxylase] ligase, partial [Hyphococcus sp.]
MEAFPSGAAAVFFDTIDSTSLEAKRCAAKGEAGPLWILARQQTAAYGRRGRGWEQSDGDVAATLILRPGGPIAQRGQLSFVTALALASALEEYISSGRISLKWPNDVMIDGKKCAGILLENADDALMIGIGVNIVTQSVSAPYATARVEDACIAAPPAPEALARRIDAHFFRFYDEWRLNGFAPIREAWIAKARGLGQPIVAQLPGEALEGVFEGLDDGGGLIMRIGCARRVITAGEVFFGRAGE